MKFFALLTLVGFAAASSRLHVGPSSSSYGSEYGSGVHGSSGHSYSGSSESELSGGHGVNPRLFYQPGHEMIYHYSGRLLTGIPELNQHQYSGIGIKCEVIVQVQTLGRVILKIRNAEYAHANEELTPLTGNQEGHNWRYLPLQHYKPVPEQSMRMLEKPILIELEGLAVKTVKASEEEPEWSINFKKAIMSLLQTQHTHPASVRGHINSGIPETWTSYESAPDGICETKYEMHEIPESLPHRSEESTEKLIPHPELCPKGYSEGESKLYEIIKVRNLDKCVKTSMYYYNGNGRWSCEDVSRPKSYFDRYSSGSCGSSWTRSSVTRYYVCGSPDRFLVQSIVNEGELYTKPINIKTEKMLTGTRQVLKLIRRSPIESHISSSESSYPKVYESLMSNLNKKHHEEHLEKIRFSSLMPENGEHISKEELIRKAEQLIKEIIHTDLFNVHGLPNEHISMKVLVLSKVFKLFDRTMLMKLYENVVRSESGEKHVIAKNILVDTIVMSGAPESIKFFKHLVESNELPKSQVASIFFNLPRTVFMPTESLLEEIFELIKSEPVRRHEFIYSTAMLSFSNLLQKSCLESEPQYSYPQPLMGRMCNKESRVVTEKWIPYLEREIRRPSSGSSSVSISEHKFVAITALGRLSHEQVLPILLPIIEEDPAFLNRGEMSESSIRLARYIAVYNLVRTGYEYPERVFPVVSTILSNKAEYSEIRIAAFHVMMDLKPDMAQLQKIVSLTWTEKDTELLRTINTAFYTVAFQTSMQDFEPSRASLIRRVRLIYPLIKKTSGHLPSSATIYTNDFLEKMNIGYEGVTSFIGSADSVIPAQIYSRLSIFETEQFRYTPYEFGLYLREVFPTLYDSLSGTNSMPFEELKSKVAGEWRQTIDKLRLKIRENGTPQAYLFMNVFEDSTLFVGLVKSGSEELKHILRNPTVLKEYLSGEKKFNYQRVFDLTPSEGMIPSDLGLFPTIMSLNMPTVLSIRGYINSDSDITRGKVEMTFEGLLDKRVIGSVGTVCPFTGEYFAGVIDEHTTMSLPMDWTLRFDVSEGKIESSVKLSTRHTTSGPYDLVYSSVTPFTVKQKLFDLRPVYKTGNMKVIKSRVPLKQREYITGGEYLGLDLKLKYKSETPYFGMRYYLEKLYNVNYNPLNLYRFPTALGLGLSTTGLPSARRHETRIVFNPESSATKEISFSFKFGYASKESPVEPIKYHKIETESSEVMKVISRPIGSFSSQPKRQEILKNMLQKLNIEKEGRAYTVLMTVGLSGSRRQVFSYSATFGTGIQGMKQKWDLRLKSETGSQEGICLVGGVTIPVFSKWSVEKIRSESPVFHYHNTLGFGPNCESKIILDGYAKVSEQQKRLSRETPEAKEYERLVRQGTPMIKMSQLAEIVRIQASSIDEIHYQIKFVNVGRFTETYVRDVLEFFQFYWLPYYRYGGESRVSSEQILLPGFPTSSIESTPFSGESNFHLEVRTRVHPLRKTFDVDVITSFPNVRYVYREIPLPYPFTYIYPLSYVHGPVPSAVKFVTGKSLYPVCTVEGKHISTFDNRTYEAKMDDCFHLLSGDCSKNVQYAVLVRSLRSGEPEGHKEVKIIVNKMEVTMKPVGGEIVFHVKGKGEIRVRPGQEVELEYHGYTIAKLTKYNDETVKLMSSKINVLFDGKKIKLEGSHLLKNKLCGLCGDNNNKKTDDLLSPRKCILSRPELFVASYRVGSLPSKQCSPLPESIRSEVEREESSERCVRPGSRRTTTRVTESYLHSYYGPSYHSSECTRMHHEVVEKLHEYCFSRIPILECGYTCHPVGVREKTVSFTCMPKDRRSEYIREKVLRGEVVPELKTYPISYNTERRVPVDCKPYSSYSGSVESTTTPVY